MTVLQELRKFDEATLLLPETTEGIETIFNIRSLIDQCNAHDAQKNKTEVDRILNVIKEIFELWDIII